MFKDKYDWLWNLLFTFYRLKYLLFCVFLLNIHKNKLDILFPKWSAYQFACFSFLTRCNRFVIDKKLLKIHSTWTFRIWQRAYPVNPKKCSGAWYVSLFAAKTLNYAEIKENKVLQRIFWTIFSNPWVPNKKWRCIGMIRRLNALI